MATRTAILGRSRAVWASPALLDGLLAYAVAMAVGVAVFTSSADRQPGSWPAYLFALGFGLILLLRRRHPVLVLILTSLGICLYYTLDYPPIGLALPIAAALFSAAEAGQLRIGIIVSLILVGLAVYFQIVGGRTVGQLIGYELPPVIALMGASLALGDGARSRRLLKESQRERERQARLQQERQAADQRTAERLRSPATCTMRWGTTSLDLTTVGRCGRSLAGAGTGGAKGNSRDPHCQRRHHERAAGHSSAAPLAGLGAERAVRPQRDPRARRTGSRDRPGGAACRDREWPRGTGGARPSRVPNCPGSADQHHPARKRPQGGRDARPRIRCACGHHS
jgi:MYXO-CTERM domain-containing protein